MIRFVLGALVGAAIVFVMMYSAGPHPVRVDRERSGAEQPSPPRAEGEPARKFVAPEGGGVAAASEPFPEGEFTLRIGEAYRFGDSAVRAADDPEADLFCQD